MTNPENYALFQDVEEAQETQETSFEGGGATWYMGEGGEGGTVTLLGALSTMSELSR